ncbi:hypothetical protein J2794_006306 [Paraburkholderia terricola]|jgi:hypothetical protein|uniref:hypothetical protein n=1 Tax=Paraburkholderia terricola TaxID=169427 RepID=UPI00285E3A9C|nr:hypothetical protein [Paraburkholderia terricola]MDR6450166.1 hypothetical protein [Paraburkholderia terricola]
MASDFERLTYTTYASHRCEAHTSTGKLASVLAEPTATPGHVQKALIVRELEMGPGTLSAHAIGRLLNITESLGIVDIGNRILHHEPTYSASEKQIFLPSNVLVQKTLSLKCGDSYVLMTGVGNWTITKRQKAHLLKDGTLPPSARDSFTINPPSLDVASVLQMAPGMVSPFLKPGTDPCIERIIIIEPDISINHTQFAISLSLFESFVLPTRHFVEVTSLYLLLAFPQIRQCLGRRYHVAEAIAQDKPMKKALGKR